MNTEQCEHSLSVNPKKTEFMIIGHQRRINEIDDFPSNLNDSEIIINEGLKKKYQFE